MLWPEVSGSIADPALPETGTDIKGHMRSYTELAEATRYSRPRDVTIVMQILENEVRLISPTDPEAANTNSEVVAKLSYDQKFYQLTHDYLVPSLRQWLENERGVFLAISTWCQRPERITIAGASYLVTGPIIAIMEIYGLIGVSLKLDADGWEGSFDRATFARWCILFIAVGISMILIGYRTIRKNIIAIRCGLLLSASLTLWEVAVVFGVFTFTMGGILENSVFRTVAFTLFFWVSSFLTFFYATAIIASRRLKNRT